MLALCELGEEIPCQPHFRAMKMELLPLEFPKRKQWGICQVGIHMTKQYSATTIQLQEFKTARVTLVFHTNLEIDFQ